MQGFQSFSRFLNHFLMAESATTSIGVKNACTSFSMLVEVAHLRTATGVGKSYKGKSAAVKKGFYLIIATTKGNTMLLSLSIVLAKKQDSYHICSKRSIIAKVTAVPPVVKR